MRKLSFSPSFLKKALKILAISLAVIAVTGFLLLPAILRPVLEKKLSEAIHRKVAIHRVSINPFTLAAALKGVTINQRDSSEVMLSFDEFYVNVQARSVVKGGLIVSSVRLVKPYVNVTRNKDLTYNFSDLMEAGAQPPKTEKPQEPFKFSINNIEVVNGSADFFDAPKNTRHTVRDVNISLPFLSNLPIYLSSYAEPSFQATVNDTAIAFKGKTLPFDESLETIVEINLKGIDLPHYLAYSPVPLNFKLISGRMDVQAAVSFRQFKKRPPAVSVKGTVGLKDIRLADNKKKPLVEFSSFSISFLPSDLMAKAVHLSDISLRAPKIYVERDRNGDLGIIRAFVPAKRVVEGHRETARREAVPAKAAPKTGAAPLPVIDIDALSIRDGMVLFIDWQPVAAAEGGEEEKPKPVRILVDAITLQGNSLSTQKDVKGTLELSLKVNKKGFFQTAGSIGLNPLDLDTRVRIRDLGLTPFQPYISQKAEVLLADGVLFAKGAARIRAGSAKGLSANFHGSASLSRLVVRDSRSNDDLLTWNELQLDGIDAGFNPLFVKINTIELSDFFAGIVVEEDGASNFQKLAKKGPAAEEKAGDENEQEFSSAAAGGLVVEEPTPPDIAIGQVLLKTGRIGFIDRHVKPTYTANLVGIDGRVSGLSSKEDLMADVLLRGSLDQYAPLEIAGKINPLRSDLFVDIRADFKDMDLSTLTPYSGTYIGNAIEKGKLSFGLQYHIANKKLEAKNDVFVDQLTLGEKIDSPQATSLPVGLAISLLKDRNGEIKLDVPVSGELNNPEFSVWRVVLQVVGNLLVKAATSPFALLGSLMGGEELGYVEFDYGAAEVTEQNGKKLDSLVNVLYERPSLKLEIAGYVDPTKDADALRTGRMKGLIVAQKMRELSPKDDQSLPPESAQISADEYPIYLKKAYKSGKFSKPRNFFGMAKDLPDAEMEKLLLASIQINDDDLRQLASQRARIVKDVILKSQKIERERIFLIEPKALLPEQKEKLKNSRVDFSLK